MGSLIEDCALNFVFSISNAYIIHTYMRSSKIYKNMHSPKVYKNTQSHNVHKKTVYDPQKTYMFPLKMIMDRNESITLAYAK